MKSMTYKFGGYAYVNLKFTGGLKFTAGMHRLILGDVEPYEGWAEENRVHRCIMPDGKLLLKGSVRTGGIRRITVDHIDGDGLNNVRANLRHATGSIQVQNRCRCDTWGRFYKRCTCRNQMTNG